jgi:hypothetical protein
VIHGTAVAGAFIRAAIARRLVCWVSAGRRAELQ